MRWEGVREKGSAGRGAGWEGARPQRTKAALARPVTRTRRRVRHTQSETRDRPQKEPPALLSRGLLGDLSTISMRFLSFSVLDATHPAGWGEDTVYMHGFTKGV